MAKTNGRTLSDDTCKLYGEQVLECLKMWGMSQADAYYAVRHMKYLVQNTGPGKWKNPLEGTGLTAPKIIDELAVAKGLAATVPESAISQSDFAKLLSKNN